MRVAWNVHVGTKIVNIPKSIWHRLQYRLKSFGSISIHKRLKIIQNILKNLMPDLPLRPVKIKLI